VIPAAAPVDTVCIVKMFRRQLRFGIAAAALREGVSLCLKNWLQGADAATETRNPQCITILGSKHVKGKVSPRPSPADRGIARPEPSLLAFDASKQQPAACKV
jgi:hypothetical protein